MGFFNSFFSAQADILTITKLSYESYALVYQCAHINIDARPFMEKDHIDTIAKAKFKETSSNKLANASHETWALMLLYALYEIAKNKEDGVTTSSALTGARDIAKGYSSKIDPNVLQWALKFSAN